MLSYAMFKLETVKVYLHFAHSDRVFSAAQAFVSMCMVCSQKTILCVSVPLRGKGCG